MSSQANCSDSLFSSLPSCSTASTSGQNNPDPSTSGLNDLNQGVGLQNGAQQNGVQRTTDSPQTYVDTAGSNTHDRNAARNRNEDLFPPDPVTDLQRLARAATGESLPIFGRDLFQHVPSTFAPGDQIPVTSDYVVGPGDEVLVRLWGPQTFNSQLTVDTSGAIYIPKVGAIHVAGLRYDALEKQISAEVSSIYRNYKISVSLGRLRSIQVYVVGEARRPGAYTISSLSSVLNALFVSGGPNVAGSLRHIQVRRGSQTFPEFDLYDLVLTGDKSKDIRLETGDTIFIPPVGAQIALGGSIRHPAIYELSKESTLGDIIDLAGGFSATGAASQVSVERIEADHSRRAMNVTLDSVGRRMVLRDGDVLYAGHIMAGYERSVTIRGNLANPGRFSWTEGMKLSDVIPDRMSLLTNDYWRERNHLGVPVPLFEPFSNTNRTGQQNYPGQNNDDRRSQTQTGRTTYQDQSGVSRDTTRNNQIETADQYNNSGQASSLAPALQGNELDGNAYARDSYGQQQSSRSQTNLVPSNSGTIAQAPPGGEAMSGALNRIRIPAAEINWSYAVIERLDPNTLKTSLIPFNLGKLVQDHDTSQNLVLQPGDVVTILSQHDVLVPQDEQTKYIRLEGEFAGSGVYSVGPNETLDQLVQRAGGLTTKAYLYGSSFNRESARVFQQQRLDEYISTLSADMERSSAVRAASSPTGVLDPNALAEQRTLISQLRQLRATGRIVLEFAPLSAGVSSIPKIPLENGDIFRVPTRPNTISVIGAVYGQNVFLYSPKRKLEDYIALAGNPNRIADKKHAFIIRADGSIYSRDRAKTVFSNNFNTSRLNPGDSIVIPEKLIKPTVMRQLLDYSQILSSFGLAAAAITVVGR